MQRIRNLAISITFTTDPSLKKPNRLSHEANDSISLFRSQRAHQINNDLSLFFRFLRRLAQKLRNRAAIYAGKLLKSVEA